MEVRPLPHGVPLPIVIQESKHRFRNGSGIFERHDHASVVRQQLFRVPIRRGDYRLSCAQRNGQRAGNDLRLLPVGRDVDIRGADMLNQLLGAHKAIDEDQVR